MSDSAREEVFQNDMISQLVAKGWKVGKPSDYNRELALYSSDLLAYVKTTQPLEWDKYCKLYPTHTENKFLEKVATQLDKVDPNSSAKVMRTYGTLGVLRNELKDRGCKFTLCQFKPENELNEKLTDMYNSNILRVVPELVYSPWATAKELEITGKKAKSWRIDLVLFVNGLPIITMELKSEFKQNIENAIKQYKKTRFAIDPVTKKTEPLLTFKRGALVHFAVSQYEVFMTTKLAGDDTYFLPFNRGTKDGGKGNDIPKDADRYATDYLWNEVLLKDNILNILAKFIHLEIEERETYEGQKYKKETMIFPRYHQWDVVTKIINSAKENGPGEKYLVQHSAGSGKSNSIAWTAHQLSALYKQDGNKQFNSIIIVTDRTILDDQLQDTITQFAQTEGIVGRINNKVGIGSKSEKLAEALTNAQPIIIVTIQTFPHVLRAIENSVNLKERTYAIIADEAHSSQTGSTAKKMKEVLVSEGTGEEELNYDDIIDNTIAAQKKSKNLSYLAFTATPKTKTLELFGNLPNPELPPNKKDNLPVAFHVYSMRQAIEEGFILDVLKNYTNYKVVYNLAMKIENDKLVESKKAQVKLNKWVKLHDYNISQKVQIIIEHFKDNIMYLLNGQAKAMVVTGSRKEAVRYKIAFDKYIKKHGYNKIHAMIAFSGEVTLKDDEDTKHTESNMNTKLKGREMRTAFDSDDFQVMIVANKFQTGFDQPKLVAMYVDKKLGGVECVQTLSRLNRIYPGKEICGTYILDFFNDPEDIRLSFQDYYQTAELGDVSDPGLVDDLFKKLKSMDIYQWHEVDMFCEAFLIQKNSNAKISNMTRPAVDRWSKRYLEAKDSYKKAGQMLSEAKKTGNAILIANSETDFKEAKKAKDDLEIFRKDLGTYVRYYEFISQIVEYNDRDYEKLSLYARNLQPLLKLEIDKEEDIDIDGVFLSHYRLTKIREQSIKLKENDPSYLTPGQEMGSGKGKSKKEDYLSVIVTKLNEIFTDENLTDKDKLNFYRTQVEKMSENNQVMTQVKNNSRAQALLGDFPKAVENAVMDSGDAFSSMQMHLFSNPENMKRFTGALLDGLIEKISGKESNI
ncbi:MAG: DEAD/DEAH box helicase family protein [Spirochaetaceae bacterium]